MPNAFGKSLYGSASLANRRPLRFTTIDDGAPRPHSNCGTSSPSRVISGSNITGVPQYDVEVGELRAGLDRHREPVADVVGRAERLHVVADVRAHELGVPLEATAREHDALAGADALRRAVVLGHDADHVAVVVRDELARRRLQHAPRRPARADP